MNAAQRLIALYIHPDKGPITPMKLDMMAVEMVALRAPGDMQNEARADEIARLIRAQFSEVDPESRRRELRSIGSRLGHADLFNGIVLRLPGIIKGSQSDQESGIEKQQVEELKREVQRYKESFQKKYQELSAKAVRLESENKRLKVLHQNSDTDLATVQSRYQSVRDALKRTQQAEQQARIETDHTQQERAALQTQLEFSQQREKGFKTDIKNLQDEIARERLKSRNALAQVKHLEAQNEELAERVATLEQQIFSGGSAHGTAAGQRSEESDLYL